MNKHSWLEIGPVQDAFLIQNERFHPLLIFTPQDVFTPQQIDDDLRPCCSKRPSPSAYGKEFLSIHSHVNSLPKMSLILGVSTMSHGNFRLGCQSPGFFRENPCFGEKILNKLNQLTFHSFSEGHLSSKSKNLGQKSSFHFSPCCLEG